MASLRKSFSYSLGKKYLMALSGLFLISFLLMHLAGNLLLYKNDNGVAFNEYSKFMSSNALVRVIEVVLVLGFLVHIFDGILLTIKNKKARPKGYAVSSGNGASFFSRTMAISGSIILIFLVLHLDAFTFKHRIYEPGNHDFYKSVVDAFQTHWGGYYWLFYVIAMVLLSLHLNHGFQSAFQSLGLNHKKYTPIIRKAGLAFSLLIPAGFASLPVYFYLKYLQII